MSNEIPPTIEQLPIELIHRIFDNLDAETIVHSVRQVSRLFRSTVNTYNRLVLNFFFISKSNFDILCRLILPQNVISLTLSDKERQAPTQIDLFPRLVPLQQFTRLRHLHLFEIDENLFIFILKTINFNFLVSLTFFIRFDDEARSQTIVDLLSSIISQSTIRKLEFHTYDVGSTLDHIDRLLQCFPHVRTLIINNTPTEMSSNSISTGFAQLTSLTIKSFTADINQIELLLLMTPSLVHLKLMSWISNLFNGKRWEEFLRTNLSQLNQLEFFFQHVTPVRQTQRDIELIISSFQTPFWIEDQKCFVICKCDLSSKSTINLYSIPKCAPYFTYQIESQRIFLSTYPSTRDDYQSIVTNVDSRSLTLRMDKSLANHILEKTTTISYPLFPKVTEIDLRFHEDWPLLSLQTLSMFIHISQIVHMTIVIDTSLESKPNPYPLVDIDIFLKQAHNLCSLIIHGNFHEYISDQITQDIYFILPRHLKHLQISIDDLSQIKLILERCENLATIRFINKKNELCQKIIKWFADNTIDTTCEERYGTISVWLGKKLI